MARKENTTLRIERDLKRQAAALYKALGVDLSTATGIFYRQSLQCHGFPFQIRLDEPNEETIAAMLEAKSISRDPSVKRYSDVEEALRALKE